MENWEVTFGRLVLYALTRAHYADLSALIAGKRECRAESRYDHKGQVVQSKEVGRMMIIKFAPTSETHFRNRQLRSKTFIALIGQDYEVDVS